MKKCEDCGDDAVRRTRCKHCNSYVCRWCYHHIHRDVNSCDESWNYRYDFVGVDIGTDDGSREIVMG